MKKIPGLWSVVSALVFLLASCTSTAHIEKDDSFDFRDHKTFAWVDKDGEGRNDLNRSNDLTEQRIREAVNTELKRSAGWREVQNRPDILLSYDVLAERTVKESNNPV